MASSVAPPCWCRKSAESRLLAVDDVEITELLERYTGLLESRHQFVTGGPSALSSYGSGGSPFFPLTRCPRSCCWCVASLLVDEAIACGLEGACRVDVRALVERPQRARCFVGVDQHFSGLKSRQPNSHSMPSICCAVQR